MKKLLSIKYGWLLLLAGLTGLNILSSSLRLRWDLTAEQRYSLSPQTKALLKMFTVNVVVYTIVVTTMKGVITMMAKGSTQLK